MSHAALPFPEWGQALSCVAFFFFFFFRIWVCSSASFIRLGQGRGLCSQLCLLPLLQSHLSLGPSTEEKGNPSPADSQASMITEGLLGNWERE